jgi:hypothetical protein
MTGGIVAVVIVDRVMMIRWKEYKGELTGSHTLDY